MGVTVSVNAVKAPVLDNEPLDDNVGGIAHVEVSPRGVTGIRAGTAGHVCSIENGSATVLGPESNGAAGCAGVGHSNHRAAAVGLSDLSFVVISPVHDDDRIPRVGCC